VELSQTNMKALEKNKIIYNYNIEPKPHVKKMVFPLTCACIHSLSAFSFQKSEKYTTRIQNKVDENSPCLASLMRKSGDKPLDLDDLVVLPYMLNPVLNLADPPCEPMRGRGCANGRLRRGRA